MRKANQRGKSGTPPMEEAEGEGLGGDGAVGAGSGAGGFLARFSTSGTRWAHFEVGPSFNPVEQSCTEVFSRVILPQAKMPGPEQRWTRQPAIVTWLCSPNQQAGSVADVDATSTSLRRIELAVWSGT